MPQDEFRPRTNRPDNPQWENQNGYVERSESKEVGYEQGIFMRLDYWEYSPRF